VSAVAATPEHSQYSSCVSEGAVLVDAAAAALGAVPVAVSAGAAVAFGAGGVRGAGVMVVTVDGGGVNALGATAADVAVFVAVLPAGAVVANALDVAAGDVALLAAGAAA
jgi:hypothetical protein